MYDNFTSKAAALPNDCSSWGITLAHQFYYALSKPLQDTLEEEDSFQLVDAQSAYLKLEKQLMADVVGASQSGTAVAALQAEIEFLCKQHSQHSSQLLKFQSKSPVESTLTCYKGNLDSSPTPCSIPDGYELCIANGVQHVHNIDTGYISKYPFGFLLVVSVVVTSQLAEAVGHGTSEQTAEFFAEFNCHIPKKNSNGCLPDTHSISISFSFFVLLSLQLYNSTTLQLYYILSLPSFFL